MQGRTVESTSNLVARSGTHLLDLGPAEERRRGQNRRAVEEREEQNAYRDHDATEYEAKVNVKLLSGVNVQMSAEGIQKRCRGRCLVVSL